MIVNTTSKRMFNNMNQKEVLYSYVQLVKILYIDSRHYPLCEIESELNHMQNKLKSDEGLLQASSRYMFQPIADPIFGVLGSSLVFDV